MKGQPISEAPRDGTGIIAEVANHYGIPETGHYAFELVSFRDDCWKPLGKNNHHMSDGCFIQWWPLITPATELDKTERTNWNYRPSNGTAGEEFRGEWCDQCVRDRVIRENYEYAVANGLGCDILIRTMVHDIGEAEYPTEWTYDRTTGDPKCTAFIRDVGQAITDPRCDKTIELFPETKP